MPIFKSTCRLGIADSCGLVSAPLRKMRKRLTSPVMRSLRTSASENFPGSAISPAKTFLTKLLRHLRCFVTITAWMLN